LNQILKRQTSRFHYGSNVPAVTIAVLITILEQNRYNSCQSSTKFSEVNVKNTFTSHIVDLIFVKIKYVVTSEQGEDLLPARVIKISAIY
jgi:hypothetical protein